MQFKFDPDQQYQLDAIDSVVNLFDGQPLSGNQFEIELKGQKHYHGSTVQSEFGFGNQLVLDKDQLYQNLREIQLQNNLNPSPSLQSNNFTVEMETGTGKTYVYLRTALELNKKYGFKKFLIVVPSVAIREGVQKSLNLMESHFGELYNHEPFRYSLYSRDRLNEIRNFAIGNELQFLIINIDAFNKKENNVIHAPQDRMSGLKPIEFLQATNPIVIMDEPQNMEGEKASQAIKSLNPLCTLRYSATPRVKYNKVYQLGPVEAFEKSLVKKINVTSVVDEDDPTDAYVKVNNITNNKGKITAKLEFYKDDGNQVKKTTKTCRWGDDLWKLSGEKGIYEGFRIDEIDTSLGAEFVRFANGIQLAIGSQNGGMKKEVIREQIRAAINNHFKREQQLKPHGIKVLSLFFIDKVENYRQYTEDGYQLGQYAEWFEEIYKEVTQKYWMLSDIPPVHKVHNGYFSKDKKGNLKNTKGTENADEDTYNIIMRDKEKLLDPNEPLRFIWSHSALREGWDNPNVFQICTLNETQSSIKKRQEIGRGLRLPVNQDGERVMNEHINQLTVIANESYKQFADSLQKEFEQEGVIFGRVPVTAFVGLPYEENGEKQMMDHYQSENLWNHLKQKGYIDEDGVIQHTFDEAVEERTFEVPEEPPIPPRSVEDTIEKYRLERHVQDTRKKKEIKLNEGVYMDPEFEKFWNAISQKTIYRVRFNSEEIIEKASNALKAMPQIQPPQIRVETGKLEVSSKAVEANKVHESAPVEQPTAKSLPDIISYIQSKTELTRKTIAEILLQSNRMKEFEVHPQKFMDQAVSAIDNQLKSIIVNGIQYEKLEGEQYAMSQLHQDIENYSSPEERIVPTTKSVYNFVETDSDVEKRYAKELEDLKNIKFFIKLPSFFKVDTPVGSYNPDWAIMMENGEVVYMIRETKGTKEQFKLRGIEDFKIQCGHKHFETIGVDYEVSTKVDDISY
jgi:type III restriction enzyme